MDHPLPDHERWELIRRCIRLITTERCYERYMSSKFAGNYEQEPDTLISRSFDVAPDLSIIQRFGNPNTPSIELRVTTIGLGRTVDTGVIVRFPTIDTFKYGLDAFLWGNDESAAYALKALRDYMVLDDLASV